MEELNIKRRIILGENFSECNSGKDVTDNNFIKRIDHLKSINMIDKNRIDSELLEK